MAASDDASTPETQQQMATPLFVTPTLARLYLNQGKLDQSEQIYQKLLEKSPDEPSLVQGLQAVQQKRLGIELDGDATGLCCLDQQQSKLQARWAVTAQGRSAAQQLLEAAGELVLRVVAFPTTSGAVASDTPLGPLHNSGHAADSNTPAGGSDLPDEAPAGPIQHFGQLELPRPENAVYVGAAVGLLGPDERFVSIAHSPPLRL